MPSQLKSDTARANGAKSKGPKTAATRKISSRNAIKHGYTARHNMLLACEDPDLFQRMVDEYTAFYQPANPVERDLVEEIIGAKWRIRRLKTIEIALVDHEMDSQVEEVEKLTKSDSGIHMAISYKGLTDDSRTTALLSRYESRLHRIYHRSHQAFLDLRQSIAAGLIGPRSASAAPQPPVSAPTSAPEPPAPTPVTETKSNAQPPSASPKKKCANEPTITRVLRRIRNHRPLNAAFRSFRKSRAPVPQARNQFKNAR
jgi:hypothetical protein